MKYNHYPHQYHFKKDYLASSRPFGIHDNNSIKLLTHLSVKSSHLNEHKFRQNFLDTLNPMCSRGSERLNLYDILPMTT